jgi:NAD(P)-dependent dehydrogenase (short-subunit alcohol dehydrogenase family)
MNERTALVTGSTDGIGVAIARTDNAANIHGATRVRRRRTLGHLVAACEYEAPERFDALGGRR